MRSLLLVLLLAFLTAIGPDARGQTFETLFADNQGRNPYASLVQESDGNFYGTTFNGGASGYGTVFKMTPAGEVTTLVSFNRFNGSNPSAGLVKGSDGNFYGTTSQGGASNYGTVFKMTPAGELTTLASFINGNGSYPIAGLVEGNDGNFYGTTSQGGAGNYGTVFKVTPAGELTTLVYFNSLNGSKPLAGLVIGSDGNFYGTTKSGGVNTFGTVFKMTPAGMLTTLVSFTGRSPSAGLLKGSDGNLYGTTSDGGTSNYGTVFRLTPAGVLTTLASFNRTNGSNPLANLVEGSDGNFYGTTSDGGTSNYGTVFKMTPAGELTTLTSFNRTNGSNPYAGLVEGSDGNFYGTTELGGASGSGTVFKMTPAGELTTFISFSLTNGSNPLAKLVEGSDGNFYGTTSEGGVSGYGTVFKVTPSGNFTTLVSFSSLNGGYPRAELVEGSDGNFYGTTSGTPSQGALRGNGTVFKVTPAGELTTLVSFDFTNGRNPYAGLVVGSDGNFYGTTSQGGANNCGTLFKMTPAGELTTLVSFDFANGSNPYAGLVEGSDGNFYGTTSQGGANNYGTVFKMTPAGELITLVSFDFFNGSKPYAGLVEGNDGNFYGTTSQGGAVAYGTVFKVTPAGVLTTLASFTRTDGRYPLAGLMEGSDGNFYGTTSQGGASIYGTVFKVTPAGVLTTLASFDGAVAANPKCSPVFGSDGKLYGTAAQMVIWRLSVPLVPGITTTPPSDITTTGATLKGTVNASGSDTTVTFEYGLTPTFGNSIVATPGTVAGRSTTAVSATLSGLAPHATYYYRLTASNSNGSNSTTGASFTTPNSRPVATNDTFVSPTNDFGPISLSVLEDDTDVDGDSLTITAVTQGSFGAVTTNGTTLMYTPGPGFVGRDTFSYTISDGIDTVSAQVELRAAALLTRALLSKDSEVPGAGQIGSGIPAGAIFKSFGVPSINSAGRLSFTASYGASKSPSELSVFVLDPKAVTSTLAARKGQIAPGTNGALFSSFKDPLLNEAGDVAFVAAVSGGDTTKQNKDGLWICPSSATNSAGTQLVARSGAQPPGAPAGARWKSFTSVVFAGAEESNTSWSLAFTAFMAPRAGGVSAANDMGLWIASPTKTVLALREGQTLTIGSTEKKLRSFAALMALPNAPGQGNGVTTTEAVAVQAFFTDGSQAVLRVSGPGEDNNVTVEALALPGDAVASIGETAAKFGIPVQSSSGTATAWIGSLNGKNNPAAIFERNLSEPELLKLLARKGDAAPGIEGASFSTFRSVAVNDTGGTLFLGKVSGRGISSSNDEGLWWKQSFGFSDSDAHGYFLRLLAREGAQPPGVPQGARWSSFTSLALSEGPYGPLFTAKLVGGAKGKGPGKITSANDQGLWAVDSKGELQLVVQEGQEVNVEGSTTPKTLKSFTVLSAVPGSPAQRRSFAGDGQIVYRALFTDGTQAVVKVQLP
ncbi:beta strand repeat-containing protein [Verrucomicrobiota bacterium sgz303538]